MDAGCALSLLLRYHAKCGHAVKYVFATLEGAFQIAVWPEARWRLDHAYQQRGFANAERLGAFAEPSHRARLDSDKV